MIIKEYRVSNFIAFHSFICLARWSIELEQKLAHKAEHSRAIHLLSHTQSNGAGSATVNPVDAELRLYTRMSLAGFCVSAALLLAWLTYFQVRPRTLRPHYNCPKQSLNSRSTL